VIKGDVTVFYILVPAFLLVGLWLIYYNMKKSELLRRFAAKRGLAYSKKAPGLDEELDRVFRLETPFARAFMLVRDVITDGRTRLMRLTELLDLSPYGTPQNTHFRRIPVYFPAPAGPDLILGFNHGVPGGSGEPRVMYPVGTDVSGDERVKRLQELVSKMPPPHPLTVTLMGGRALAYLEPLMVGSEGESEADYLLEFARKFRS